METLIFVSSCISYAPADSVHLGKYVRVVIIQDTESLSLKVRGFSEIMNSDNKILYRGRNTKTTVAAYKNGILMMGMNLVTDKVLVKPDDSAEILINGRRFRGDIQINKNDDSRLSVINYINLEDYVKGVLYHEVSHYWPAEALRAQAVVCRSFAFYQTRQNSKRDYDVTSDIYSQVYGGRTSERYRTNRAVDQTRGYILTYQGTAFPAYFHATCAGHTEDSALLWDIDIAPLKGVICNFCKDSPHFSWHYVLSVEGIRDKLIKAGYKIGKIIKVERLFIDKSGRIIDLKILSVDKEIKISAKNFRNIIGPNVIRSTNFNVKIINQDLIFEGFGWGHGVGLCQWGAYFMAKQGHKYDEILRYYYPQAVITSIPDS